MTHRFTPQSKQDVTTSTPRTEKRTILPTTIHVDGQNNPMVSSLSITNTKTKMTDKPYKEESMVKPVPSWQVGLVATSMCGWVVAAIAVIAAVALCCWSRRNRRGKLEVSFVQVVINNNTVVKQCTFG